MMHFMKRLLWVFVVTLFMNAHGFSSHAPRDIKIVDIDASIHIDGSTTIILDSLSSLLEKYDDEIRVRIAKKWQNKVKTHSNMSSYVFIPETFRRKVLLIDGDIFGVVDYFALQDSGKGYIETLAVKPNNDDLDTATLLIEHAIHDLMTMGFLTIESHVFASDSEGKRCYENLGFTSIPNQDNHSILCQRTYPALQ